MLRCTTANDRKGSCFCQNLRRNRVCGCLHIDTGAGKLASRWKGGVSKHLEEGGREASPGELQRMKIKAWKDFWAGLMFIGIGLVFAIGANHYPMGSAVRMGPAYFPKILGWLTVALGVVVFIMGFVREGEKPRAINWKIMGWILGAVVAFGLLTGPLNAGLVLACLAIVIMSAYGGYDFRIKEVIPLAVGITIVTVLVFVNGLGLPFQLWPKFISG
jgi:hypothetical protein